MKTSIPKALHNLCWILIMMLCCFQLGAQYAASPYRTWFTSSLDRSKTTLAHVEFTRIGVEQSQTLLFVAYATVALSALGLVFLLVHILQKKGSIHFPGLRAPQKTLEAR